MTDACGVLHCADGSSPRKDDGYRLADNARALVVVCREPRPAPNVSGLSRRYLDFVLAAVQPDGRCHNAMSAEQLWTDAPDVGDGWGHAMWSLGVAATSAENSALQGRALNGFRVAAKQRSPQRHAMAFAGLGAAEVLRKNPEDKVAAQLLDDAARCIWWDEDDDREDWHWPEPRLRYANATLAEAMLLAGDLLAEDDLYSRGLEMLQFLLDLEIRDGRLTVTREGHGPDDEPAAAEQRPVEVAALADACASAFRITRERRWFVGVDLAWAWFLGENSAGTPMFDQTTGGGYDVLGETERSDDQGAEATLAMLAVAQHARRMLVR